MMTIIEPEDTFDDAGCPSRSMNAITEVRRLHQREDGCCYAIFRDMTALTRLRRAN